MKRGVVTKILLALAMLSLKVHGAVTPDLQRAIRSSTFEVVRKKPAKDPLTYEKPLPLDLLPYKERTDPYDSIGTAFALGNNTYVTAAHVLAVGVNSQFGPPSLRASNGAVYQIDKVEKFSAFMDFAVFSLADDPKPKGFAIGTTAQVDDAVLAVGNALGEGIVIRDGLFTSETHEDQDGRWKWIRFSAAASPGNSGGPLLDSAGNVIGIVIGKSENENLNYSLPIKEMLSTPEGKAMFEQRTSVGFPILRNTRTYSYSEEFALPLKWPEFAAAYEQLVRRHAQLALGELLMANRDITFPNGPGTESLLFDTNVSFEPRLIVQKDDKTWSAQELSFARANLPGDGFISTGNMTGRALSFVRLHRSNSAADDAFYFDSKEFMDVALKGMNFSRRVGNDNVRIDSLGKAVSDSLHVDRYGRKWQQRVWAIPYQDAYIAGSLLPTPDGYVALLEYVPSLLLNILSAQSKILLDYVDVSYAGTVAQWQAFVKRHELLPASFEAVAVKLSGGLSLSSKRVAVVVPNSVLTVDSASELELGMSFVREGQNVEWNIGSVRLSRDSTRKSYVFMKRHRQPPSTAPLELRNKFDAVKLRRSPFDMITSREQGNTYSIGSVAPAPSKTEGKTSSDLLYGVTLALEGSRSAELTTKVRTLLSSVRIIEQGEVVEPGSKSKSDQKVEAELIPMDPYAAQRVSIAEKLRAWKSRVDEQSAEFGTDMRQRSFTQDMQEFVVEPFEKLLADESFVGYSPEMDQLSRRVELLGRYWMAASSSSREKLRWPKFLAVNALPVSTARSAEVLAFETKLAETLLLEPSEAWVTDARALLAAQYLDRTNRAMQGPLRNINKKFLPRKTPCPARKSTTSGGRYARATPESLRSLEDNYPAASRRAGDEGIVFLELKVDANGCASAARVIGSTGYEELDAAALELYELMEFYPADKGGKPVSSFTPFPINYRMKEL